jgi:protein-L-isoaspartate(D-aspartate) O-methyltransferase
VDGDSLSYFTVQRIATDAEPRFQLGAIGHGPIGQQVAERLCEEIRNWDQDRTAHPVLSAHPANTPDSILPAGLVIDKVDSRLVVIPA